jgi:hypothetical protein
VALYQPSVAVGAIAGSIGRIVFSKSYAGPTMRTNYGQLAAETAARSLIKGSAVALSKKWKALTPAQRSAWATFGIAHPHKTTLGNSFALPGNIAFIMCNQAARAAGNTTEIDDPPTIYSAGSPVSITPNWTPSPQTITITPSSAPVSDEVPIVWFSGPDSPGRTRKKNHMRTLQVFPQGNVGPWDITANLLAKVGLILPAQAYTFVVQYTQYPSGAQGIEAIAQLILTP